MPGTVQKQLIKLQVNSVSACMEQCMATKFLLNEDVQPADIYRRHQAKYVVEMFSRSRHTDTSFYVKAIQALITH